MRRLQPLPALLGIILILPGLLALLAPPPVHAAAGDTIADRVLGQRRFGTAIPYFVDGTALDAADIAIDRSAIPNRVYIASPDLNRVLGWSDLGRFRAGAPADLVLGQPSVYNGSYAYTYLNCPAPPSATTFCAPDRVAVDPAGNLYVIDAFNFRVLEFDRPFATDRVADRVFGQASFTARTVPALLPINFPADLAVDAQGNLWVVDPAGTRRILEYDAPVSRGKGPVPAPDRIIAAAMEAACWNGTPARPCSPFSLEFSPQGDLYVVDFAPGKPSRQLIYKLPLKTDLKADFTLTPAPESYFQQPGVFDAAGDLVFLASGQVWRYAAPIGPGTQPEVLSPPFDDIGFLAQLALDSRGNLYVASYQGVGEASFVYIVDTPFQAAPARVGSERETTRGLAMPDILAIDRSASPNHLYVVDAYGRVLGWRDAEGFANGAAADLVLGEPIHGSLSDRGGLAVDSHGNLWVADADNHRVLELDPRTTRSPTGCWGRGDRSIRASATSAARAPAASAGRGPWRSIATTIFTSPTSPTTGCCSSRTRRRTTLRARFSASRTSLKTAATRGARLPARPRSAWAASRGSPTPNSSARRASPWTRRGTSAWPTR